MTSSRMIDSSIASWIFTTPGMPPNLILIGYPRSIKSWAWRSCGNERLDYGMSTPLTNTDLRLLVSRWYSRLVESAEHYSEGSFFWRERERWRYLVPSGLIV